MGSTSRFEFDWPTLQLLLITVLAFVVGLAGCAPLADTFASPTTASVPNELAPFQGKWKLDHARTDAAHGLTDDAEASAEEKAFLNAMKSLGVVMSDIEIRGTQITQLSGILRAQYDLLDYKSESGRIVGKALWHEDRHDPGDASEINVSLELDGEKLIFSREEDGYSERYYFTR